MAGVKVTDLTPTSTAAIDDVMYIVDTSSNTSKQIEVQNIYSGMPQFESGSYTPTVSNETYSEVVTPYTSFYTKVGNVVNVSIRLDVQLDAAQTDAAFELSLPVATTFSGPRQVNGSITFDTNISNVTALGLNSIPSGSTIQINITSNTAGDLFSYVFVTAQYLVI